VNQHSRRDGSEPSDPLLFFFSGDEAGAVLAWTRARASRPTFAQERGPTMLGGRRALAEPGVFGRRFRTVDSLIRFRFAGPANLPLLAC